MGEYLNKTGARKRKQQTVVAHRNNTKHVNGPAQFDRVQASLEQKKPQSENRKKKTLRLLRTKKTVRNMLLGRPNLVAYERRAIHLTPAGVT